MAEYSKEIAEEICDRIANGGILSKICALDGMPDRLSFYRWMASHADLANAYARARLLWADWWAEKALLISLDGTGDIFLDETGKSVVDHANIQRARLQAEQIRWTVGKYAPRVYGDKPEPIDAGGPMKVMRIERVIVDAPEPPDVPAYEHTGPRLLAWDSGPMPSRLHGEIVVRLVSLIKSRMPGADLREPEAVLSELFGIIDRALIAEYGEAVEGVR